MLQYHDLFERILADGAKHPNANDIEDWRICNERAISTWNKWANKSDTTKKNGAGGADAAVGEGPPPIV